MSNNSRRENIQQQQQQQNNSQSSSSYNPNMASSSATLLTTKDSLCPQSDTSGASGEEGCSDDSSGIQGSCSLTSKGKPLKPLHPRFVLVSPKNLEKNLNSNNSSATSAPSTVTPRRFSAKRSVLRNDEEDDASSEETFYESIANRIHTVSKGFPLISSSYMKFLSAEQLRKRMTPKETTDDLLGEGKDGVGIQNGEDGISYEQSFTCDSGGDNYHPHFLDDPDLRSGMKRKVITLPGLIISNIPFIKTKELKKELNEQFREKHSHINPSFTLSKLRKLKERMLNDFALCPNPLVEVSTVALAVVYLEKLILKNHVTKQNRHLVTAVCLFLAMKWNHETPGGPQREKQFNLFFQQADDSFSANRKKILQYEFKVFSLLNFDLTVRDEEFYPHFKRLLMSNSMTPQEYLGEKIYFQYFLQSPASPPILSSNPSTIHCS